MIYDAYIYQKNIDHTKDLNLDIKRINDDHYQSIIKCLKLSVLREHARRFEQPLISIFQKQENIQIFNIFNILIVNVLVQLGLFSLNVIN